MPMMKSPAGDMEIIISKVTADKTRLVTSGKFGAWDSTIYFGVDDVSDLVKMMLNGPVIWFIMKLPILFITSKLSRSKRS